jgi:hypothetical protein
MSNAIATIGIGFSTLGIGLAIGVAVTQWLSDRNLQTSKTQNSVLSEQLLAAREQLKDAREQITKLENERDILKLEAAELSAAKQNVGSDEKQSGNFLVGETTPCFPVGQNANVRVDEPFEICGNEITISLYRVARFTQSGNRAYFRINQPSRPAWNFEPYEGGSFEVGQCRVRINSVDSRKDAANINVTC